MWQKQGKKGLVLYLKACYVLTMQATAGQKIKSTQSLGVAVARSADGLPRVIPAVMRGMIRSGDLKSVKIWLSFFSIYRVIEFKSFASLKTIVEPGVTISPLFRYELDSFAKDFVFYLFKKRGGELRGDLDSPVKAMIYRSSPSVAGLDKSWAEFKYSTSWFGLRQAAVSLVGNDRVWTAFKAVYAKVTSLSDKGYWNYLTRIEDLALSCSDMEPGHLGRLGFKQEAAGKVRVFAMVDCWTQWLLKPVHLAIFDLLELFPSDGTKDQMRPIHRLIEQGFTRFWCYDLSAATDRLPLSIQISIVNSLFGDNFGNWWAEVLVGRPYAIPEGCKYLRPSDRCKGSVSYAVGQPMGALSSWAMLALTHHFLVAFAAKRAGYTLGTFTSYAVLGDDIVIANGRVAQQYLILMEQIGVKIGLAKSLVSRRGTLEFAKRFLVRGVDASPIPFKEVGSAVINGPAMIEFAKKYGNLSLSRLASLMGYGYRVKARLSQSLASLPKRVRNLAIVYYSPWGVLVQDLGRWLNIETGNLLHVWSADEGYPEGIVEVLLTRVNRISKRIRGYLKSSMGYGPKDINIPKSDEAFPIIERGEKVDPYDDKFWLTYWTIRDQINTFFKLAKDDVAEINFWLTQFSKHEEYYWDPSSFMKIDSLLRRVQLFKKVSEIVKPERDSAKADFLSIVRIWRSVRQRELKPYRNGIVIHDKWPLIINGKVRRSDEHSTELQSLMCSSSSYIKVGLTSRLRNKISRWGLTSPK